MQVKRRAFYELEKVLRDVRDKVEKTRDSGEEIDYLTFVPDGEPTLDINLGREIERLKSLGIKIAVISNSSLIWREDVRDELMNADWVSLKMDALQEKTWRKVNRPYGTLELEAILDGALEFASNFKGELSTETMLVEGINDTDDNLRAVADFLARLSPSTAYLAIPTRPPAEEWAGPPDEEIINRAYQVLNEKLDRVEYLIGYEGNAFSFTGDVEDDLLSITSVHPMREDAVGEFLSRAEADWAVVNQLIDQGQLVRIDHNGRAFYMRKLHPTM